ncbi:MAG TPA: ZIP family metal transporter [Candidatus Binataceae bacterium]|nr:ZIP family metal transporter [Candidatus Binataceae bacterium]
MAIMFACLTFVSTGLGGLAAIRLRDRLHLLLGFSSGAVIAVVLFDIFPEIFDVGGAATPVMPVVALGFLTFFGLERLTALHRSREHAHQTGVHPEEFGVIAAAGLSVHSFLDGFAIGVGFEADVRIGVLISLAVIAHDFSDGLNTVTVVLAHDNPLERAIRWLLIDMVTPILGAIAALSMHFGQGLLPWLLAFFAGSFLYIGASDLLPEAREHDSPIVGLATAGAMVLMFLISRLLRGH